MTQGETAGSEEQRNGGKTLPASKDSEEEGRNTAGEVADKNIESRSDQDIALPDSGGNPLPALRYSVERDQNTDSEVADKNTGSRRDSDMAPPNLEVSNESKTPLSPETTQDGPVSRSTLLVLGSS